MSNTRKRSETVGSIDFDDRLFRVFYYCANRLAPPSATQHRPRTIPEGYQMQKGIISAEYQLAFYVHLLLATNYITF